MTLEVALYIQLAITFYFVWIPLLAVRAYSSYSHYVVRGAPLCNSRRAWFLEILAAFIESYFWSATMESLIVEDKTEPTPPVDREKTCPLLLRVFCNTGRHHPLGEYVRGNVPSNELQIYTWMDATLKELTSLVKEVNPEARRKGTYFDFAIIYPNPTRPGYRTKEIGTTCSGQKGADDSVTLASKRFQVGDYLSIAITPPSRGPPRRMDRMDRMRPY
ncbi:PREDICTED: histone deacetylase complex subunit SAP18-like [Priapulus caudatus]|uniref:18 kDa Sin3-associated polypeptide n=1 Tax=Priapulus caudatus TaxID=37621 RepID=A0ABM1EAG8_PRICU|nr:PREDICTED: histone deacetylase complex subunit SAP18-like [Priapulus caudatus]